MVTDAFNTPARVIVRAIEDDTWLCRRVLAAVNGGRFYHPRPIVSIKQAVALFGLVTVVHVSDRIRWRETRAPLLEPTCPGYGLLPSPPEMGSHPSWGGAAS